jgi:metal-responsive CopG/Arc/MetJ family transcriptional regulator
MKLLRSAEAQAESRTRWKGADGKMKVKTSVTLSKDLLCTVDRLSGRYRNRSEFIEAALRAFIAQLVRNERNARDLEIINQRADDLNAEALDVIGYQVGL